MPRSRRSAATPLAGLLDRLAQPVYAVDEQRRIVFCNAACAAWLGVSADQLVGLECRYHAEANRPLDALANMLCPPPGALAGEPATLRLQPPISDETAPARWAQFVPLAVPDPSVSAVLVLVDAEPGADEAPPPSVIRARAETPAELHAELAAIHRRWLSAERRPGVIGRGAIMARVRAQVELAAAGTAPVLVVGRPGSGREHVARAIHHAAPVESKRLVAFDARLLAPGSLYTQWSAEAAPPATLLIRDIQALEPSVQSELHLLLTRQPHVRLLATAEQRLDALVAERRMHEELAIALGTLVIALPPLADRLDDVPLLAQLFLERENALVDKQLGGFTPEALDRLCAHAWPGNLDELAAIVREAHARAEIPFVRARDLPEGIGVQISARARRTRDDAPIALDAFLADVERDLIRRALDRAKGNKSRAAALLGLTRPRLYRRLVQLGLVDADSEGSGGDA